MQPSDFLTILGLALAIWSFIPNKERDFILLFFSKFEIGVFIFGLFYIHLLMSFDWILNNWCPWLSKFTVSGGIPANIYAYIISLIIIVWPILKVAKFYFSGSRLDDLISLYKSLLYDGDAELLHKYISKYHEDDIKQFLIGLSHLPEKESIEILLRSRTEADEKYESLISPKRIRFASYVYGKIIQDETFVRIIAPIYPEFFGRIFIGIENENASNEELIKLFLEVVFETKNKTFIHELKIVNDSFDSIEIQCKRTDLTILRGILVNTKAASANSVWYPIGEGMVKSLNYDREQKDFLLKEYDSDLKLELWNQKIWIGTVYFNYMVRETIYRDSKWHMWLFYYRTTVELLIENIPKVNKYDHKLAYPSFIHYILDQTFGIMLEWLELAEKLNTKNRVIDTIRCLGWCLNLLNQADEDKISRKFKVDLWDRVIYMYYNIELESENIASSTIKDWLIKLFLNPRRVDKGEPEITDEYISILNEAWNNFDKIPLSHHGQDELLKDFVVNILNPLGIEDDEYDFQ